MAEKIDYFFTLTSPWSYLGHADFLRIATEHGVEVSYKPIPLQRLFPETGGLPLAKRHPARQNYRMLELQRWREKRHLKLRLTPKFWPFDPALVDRLIIALVSSGAMVETFLPQAFMAVFADEQNLADEAVLSALLSEAGLDAETLMSLAKSESVAAEYEKNLQEALQIGIFGVPSYVLNGEIFWGQDRVEFLDEALKSHRAAYTSGHKEVTVGVTLEFPPIL
jgi:2-hydroxychromene-2-carboxylate isomerase